MNSRWYYRRDALFVAIVTAVVLAYIGWGYVAAPGRITDDLHSAIAAELVDVEKRLREKAEEIAADRVRKEAADNGLATPRAVTESDVEAAMDAARMWVRPSVDVLVVTKVVAERFHLDRFQDIGRYQIIGAREDREILLLSVRPDDIHSLARHYWIERIDLAPSAES